MLLCLIGFLVIAGTCTFLLVVLEESY